MKRGSLLSRSFVVLIIFIMAYVLDWLFLPAWTFKSPGFWLYLVFVFGVAGLLFDFADMELCYVISGLVAFVLFVSMLIFVVFKWIFVNDESESESILKGCFTENIENIKEDSDLITVDIESAKKLGNRINCNLENNSRYSLSDDYNLVDVNGKYFWIAPIESSVDGIPGYVMVDVSKNEAEIVKLGENIKYSPSAFGKYDLRRYLRKRYPKYFFGEEQFEIDDNGHPYYVVPTMNTKKGFKGQTVSSFIIVDAISGEVNEYEVEDLPNWVDNAYSLNYLMEIADYETNNELTYQYDHEDKSHMGYSPIINNGQIYFMTGMYQKRDDELIVGFVTTNLRTGEIAFYDCVGARESSVMSSAESLVKEGSYSATQPMIVNVDNQETWFVVLKDDNDKTLNRKRFAFVNIKDYTKAVQAETIEEALQLYRKEIGTEEETPQQDKA